MSDQHEVELRELENLIRKAKRRNKAAISQLYERYAPRIYRYIAYRVTTTSDAEDLTGEVFMNMVEKLPGYKITGAPFEAWLFKIAAARVADFHRRLNRRPQTDLSDNLQDHLPMPEEHLQKNEEFESLREALQHLTDEQQQILVLRFVERKSHQEVAEIVNKSVSAVKSIQHRALVQLSAWLGSGQKARHYLRGDQ